MPIASVSLSSGAIRPRAAPTPPLEPRLGCPSTGSKTITRPLARRCGRRCPRRASARRPPRRRRRGAGGRRSRDPAADRSRMPADRQVSSDQHAQRALAERRDHLRIAARVARRRSRRRMQVAARPRPRPPPLHGTRLRVPRLAPARGARAAAKAAGRRTRRRHRSAASPGPGSGPRSGFERLHVLRPAPRTTPEHEAPRTRSGDRFDAHDPAHERIGSPASSASGIWTRMRLPRSTRWRRGSRQPCSDRSASVARRVIRPARNDDSKPTAARGSRRRSSPLYRQCRSISRSASLCTGRRTR